MLVNGKQYVGSLEDPEEFAAFVLQAAGEAYSSHRDADPHADRPPRADAAHRTIATARRDCRAVVVFARMSRRHPSPAWRNW